MGKPWYKSKTLFVNAVAFVAAIGTAFGAELGLDAETQATLIAGIMAIINFVLRLVTKEPIEAS